VKRASHTGARGSPEILADELMTKIFRGVFPAGAKLPSERQLAEDLGVDRTTLRMALKQLQRMNLVVVRHGSGIEVNDYRAHGGLDVLAAMFALEDLALDGSLLVEALDFWQEGFSMTAAKAVARMSLGDLRELEVLLDRSIAGGKGDLNALVEAQLEIQDTIARMSGSVMFRMLSNSTRSLRRRILRLLPETVDMVASLEEMKRMLRLAAVTRPSEALIREGLLDALRKQTATFRERALLGRAPSGARRPRLPGGGSGERPSLPRTSRGTGAPQRSRARRSRVEAERGSE
jgi:GntR family transcriptional regulator, transcriptional repressor for pyruvate dehydrogenase complex